MPSAAVQRCNWKAGGSKLKAPEFVRVQCHLDLMRHRRCDRCDGMSQPGHDRPVVVAADDPLHLAMPGDDSREFRYVPQIDPVHVGNAAGKRRVMHADDGRLVRSRGQDAIEELQLLGTQLTVPGTRHQRIQHDQPDRIFVHGVPVRSGDPPQRPVGASGPRENCPAGHGCRE